MIDGITFAQLQACLRAASDVLSGDITHDDLAEHVEHCAIVENAEYRHEMIDLAGRMISVVDRSGGGRSAVRI